MHKIMAGDSSSSIVCETSFDCIRHAGDKEFVCNNSFEKNYYSDPKEEQSMYYDTYWRPKNCDDAVRWIKANIIKSNQKRLIDAVLLMKEDDSLYFYNGW